MSSFGRLASQGLGWLSTLSWSISFYPQAILNARRKSVRGLSMDFVYLNVQGFLAYSIYNIAMLASPVVRKEYQERNDGHNPSVRGNDVAFAVHAFVLSSITLGQTFLYARDGKQAVSSYAMIFMTMTSILVITGTFGATLRSIAWLDLLYYLSYLKIVISFVKFMPQAILNFRRRSTVGWSIHNILLDFTGGVCSLAQLLLDAQLHEDWGSLRGNPAKLLLGLIAISFDILFLIQHYILYRHADPTAESDGESTDERTSLLNHDI